MAVALTPGNLLRLVFNLFFPPFLCVVLLTLVLASFGRSLGIRKLYVRALIRIFEFAGRSAREAKKLNGRAFYVGDGEAEDGVSEGEEGHGSREDIHAYQSRSQQHKAGSSPSLSPSSEDGKWSDFEDASFIRREKMRSWGKESRHNVISRKDNLILNPDGPSIAEEGAPSTPQRVLGERKRGVLERLLSGREVSAASFQREFELQDAFAYIKTGIASIIEDEVTQRFEAEELKNWNLLTRTSESFVFVNTKLTLVWICGFIFRYFVLLPGRTLILCVGLLWLSLSMSIVGLMPDGPGKRYLHHQAYTSSFQILGGAISAVIQYHNKENVPKGGICVANHTSPIDVLILACDNAYALIGQRHGGFLGFMQNIVSKCSHHIWFERSELKDRSLVAKRLREHVEDPDKLPILVFPEGTCINNTSVMQFKKGSFEIGGKVYPVAIKYDPLFGDAFWNSSKYGMLSYIYMMMTSWAIVCDVWYLPPMVKKENEDAIHFASRVKAVIARQGGLVDLTWDGNLKRAQVKSEWKAKQQEAFSQRLKVE